MGTIKVQITAKIRKNAMNVEFWLYAFRAFTVKSKKIRSHPLKNCILSFFLRFFSIDYSRFFSFDFEFPDK